MNAICGWLERKTFIPKCQDSIMVTDSNTETFKLKKQLEYDALIQSLKSKYKDLSTSDIINLLNQF